MRKDSAHISSQSVYHKCYVCFDNRTVTVAANSMNIYDIEMYVWFAMPIMQQAQTANLSRCRLKMSVPNVLPVWNLHPTSGSSERCVVHFLVSIARVDPSDSNNCRTELLLIAVLKVSKRSSFAWQICKLPLLNIVRSAEKSDQVYLRLWTFILVNTVSRQGALAIWSCKLML